MRSRGHGTTQPLNGHRTDAGKADSWREFICRMIHSVSVENASPNDFAAQISARRHGNVSCTSFWSKSHEIYGRRETFGSAGASGYLVSWQIEGEAQVTQEGRQFLLQPGEVAILDGRRPMTVRFPGEVRRVIANLPAKDVATLAHPGDEAKRSVCLYSRFVSVGSFVRSTNYRAQQC
ncbi:AraC-like ligand-binding domain-containing protein [Paraburkholderia sediminicola]|uniref:AraC-like ligand-binding domain-containing protein n=1 Tax=Paraburkholderia sediminicola TaxID=458836 RepID=UPI0038B9BD94